MTFVTIEIFSEESNCTLAEVLLFLYIAKPNDLLSISVVLYVYLCCTIWWTKTKTNQKQTAVSYWYCDCDMIHGEYTLVSLFLKNNFHFYWDVNTAVTLCIIYSSFYVFFKHTQFLPSFLNFWSREFPRDFAALFLVLSFRY